MALSCLAACSRPPAGQQTEPVALKDYHPESSLRVPLGHIDKARYLAIDVHSHSEPLMTTPENVTEWVAMMDATGVEATVVISDAIGAEFEGQARLFLGKYRNRFQLYCSLDHRDFENADFPQRAVRELERCYRAGARGLGELTDKGWGLMGGLEALAPDQELKAPPRDKRLNVDDPRLDPLWEKCAELNLPVILHVADHPSSYRPLGPTQERIPAYDRFNNYGKDVPTFDELMTMRDRVLARHPRTKFIAAHLGNQGHDLSALAAVLDRFPNLFLDLSARDYELGRQPRNAARFLKKYSGRVLFGTDYSQSVEMTASGGRFWSRRMSTCPDQPAGGCTG